MVYGLERSQKKLEKSVAKKDGVVVLSRNDNQKPKSSIFVLNPITRNDDDTILLQ